MEKNKTLGAITSELSQKTPDTLDPIEIQREMQKEYMLELQAAVDRGYNRYDKDFFIHVETKKEKLFHNTFRIYFIDRHTCPTPNYDQAVYKYNREKGQIEYIWSIPDRETCYHLLDNARYVVKSEHELLDFVIKFANGSLYKLCKKLNGEKLETPELIKKD